MALPTSPAGAPGPVWINAIPALMPIIAVVLFFTVLSGVGNAWLIFLPIPATGILFRRNP